MVNTKVLEEIVDTCSKSSNVFAPLQDLPDFCTQAEAVSQCLNVELMV